MKISKRKLLQEAATTEFRPEILEKVWYLMALLKGAVKGAVKGAGSAICDFKNRRSQTRPLSPFHGPFHISASQVFRYFAKSDFPRQKSLSCKIAGVQRVCDPLAGGF
jgi:hypothetical protein